MVDLIISPMKFLSIMNFYRFISTKLLEKKTLDYLTEIQLENRIHKALVASATVVQPAFY